MDPKLTNHKIFQADPEKRYDHFLSSAIEVADIHLARTPVGGLRDPEGQHLGDALVDIPQRYVYHSPAGFEWGYGGSGPADLALNILGLFLEAPEAWRLHQDYKQFVICRIPKEGGVIPAASVRTWIQDYWHEERQVDA